MKFENYLAHFEAILANPQEYTEYQDPEYLNYAKLNWSRMNRWLKKFEPSAAMKAQIAAINSAQVWTVITEPWCGDAGHSVPMLYRIAQENPHIDFQIHLRDAEPFLIDSYLTNGGKAIPKLSYGMKPEKTSLFGDHDLRGQQLFSKNSKLKINLSSRLKKKFRNGIIRIREKKFRRN